MNHLDLFSGIGGFSLAAHWVWGDKHNVVAFVEKDEFCQKVLKKHWPGVPIVEDIRDVEKIMAYANAGLSDKQEREIQTRWNTLDSSNRARKTNGFWDCAGPTIDLLTGGFPCQPFSVAGKQGGKADDRYLWPPMLRVVAEIHPTWIIAENVPGIIRMELDTVLSDLENEGYETGTLVLPACAKDAPHRRDRVWIVANTIDRGSQIRRTQSDGKMEQGTIAGEASLHVGATFEKPSLFPRINNVPNSRLLGSQEHEEQATGLEQFSEDVADTRQQGGQQRRSCGSRRRPESKSQIERNGWGKKSKGNELWKSQPSLGIPNDGFSRWLVGAWGSREWEEGIPRVASGVKDRVNKLKALGNAIVPQVVMPIMEAIKEIES